MQDYQVFVNHTNVHKNRKEIDIKEKEKHQIVPENDILPSDDDFDMRQTESLEENQETLGKENKWQSPRPFKKIQTSTY